MQNFQFEEKIEDKERTSLSEQDSPELMTSEESISEEDALYRLYRIFQQNYIYCARRRKDETKEEKISLLKLLIRQGENLLPEYDKYRRGNGSHHPTKSSVDNIIKNTISEVENYETGKP
jgi:hypothetical protein